MSSRCGSGCRDINRDRSCRYIRFQSFQLPLEVLHAELEIYARYVTLALQTPQGRILVFDKNERTFHPVALRAHNGGRPEERGLGRGN